MKLEIADIATDEKKKLQGFKVLGIFPFYLRYIRTGTHIQLCRLKEQMQTLTSEEPKISDFNDSKLQEQLVPLLNAYCVTALANNRDFGWFFKFLLMRKIKKCGHYHILSIYFTIQKLNEPAFFLTYWRSLNQKNNTLLKEEEPSSEKSSRIKKEQE